MNQLQIIGRGRRRGTFAVLLALATASISWHWPVQAQYWTVFATGLTNPRHMSFGPDGLL